MNFVERVNALAGAREILGVGHRASVDEIRAAWKRLAFETHPDRNGGTRTAFDRAKAAYALLLGFTFAPYMSRFQIRPEERALEQTHGREFLDYCRRVRRWL